jgi:AcrR family transcriptional regulator
MTVAHAPDVETRDRLLEAATALFAELGYGKVTVRDICQRARANVAAVNYHFGGKTGLYDEVLNGAIATMQATTALAREQGAGQPPGEQLAAYVRVFVQRIAGGARTSRIHQLMMHEMSNPTPAFDRIVDEVIRPRMAYLDGIVAALLHCPPDDPRVSLCALSIHAQCMSLLNSHIGERISPALRITPSRLDDIAEHITRFSLAGIQRLV